MNLNDIGQKDIDRVVQWYYEVNTAKTPLKKRYWKKKGKVLQKKLGWKFYMVMQELISQIKEKGA